MKQISSLIALLIATFSIVQAQELNLKDITAGKYYGKGVPNVVSSADGEHYFQANKENTKIVKYAYKTGQEVQTIFDVTTARDCSINSFQGFLMSPDENRLLVYTDREPGYRHSFKATYHYFDIRRNMLRKLTSNSEKQAVPVFSKDGRMVAFVVNNNIWLAKFDYGSESQITKDGELGKIINGATDWVYEEEFGTTHIMDFSADNTLLAFACFDESEVSEFAIQKFNNRLYPELFSIKYPKAGEKNAKIAVKVFDIDAKTTRAINIPPSNLEYIPKIEFGTTGNNLAIMTLNREQNEFNMYFADARTTVCKQILREINDKYIDTELLSNTYFFDNQFIYMSERDGYSHLYLYQNNGTLTKQLTSGKYDVTKLLAVDALKGIVYFESAEESPLRRDIYKVDIKKGAKVKLSNKQGYNTAMFSKEGKYFINKYTNLTTPTITTLHDNNGKQLRVLEDNKELENTIAKLNLPKKEFITLKSADGQDINGYIMKPTNFNTSQKYPLVMVQYSGPNSQSVTDRFGIDWTSYLVNQGYIVACVDGRGTGARGEAFRKCNYMNLGTLEADDQIAAAEQLGKYPYIDRNKIAIWGWSYGGYNVLMSMSRSKGVFRSGIAIAPVTDWKFYDTVYGERYMRTPQQNTLGYKTASAVEQAANLDGNLLLIHGSADDNVHIQNTIAYSEALIKANKQFEMFMFPDSDHSIGSPANRNYLYTKIINFLKKNM